MGCPIGEPVTHHTRRLMPWQVTSDRFGRGGSSVVKTVNIAGRYSCKEDAKVT